MPNKTRWLYAGAGALAALLVVPAAVAGYVHHRDVQRRAKLADFLKDPIAGDEGWHEQFPSSDADDDEGGDRGVETDDALKRMVMARTLWGVPTPATQRHLTQVAYAESRRWRALFPSAPHRSPGTSVPTSLSPTAAPSGSLTTTASVVSGQSWVNLGPTDASFEWNGSSYSAVDSGRPNTILVNPSDTSIVYLATSGGGVWKTYNFNASSTTWEPITEALGNLAIGAMALDPESPDTLYVGLGDFVDTPGGEVAKSSDGGGSWGAPVSLTGTYPAASGGLSVTALRVHDIKVDPVNSNIVLVGTDVGLFRSTDAGLSYSLVDLPNSGTQLAEEVWSIAYTGSSSSVSHWAISGVYACDAASLPPSAGSGTVAGTSCTGGNPGDIWTSSDAGATWTSRKAANALPTVSGGVGRISLGAGSTATAATTVIYAQLGNEDEYNGSSAVGYWRSNDAGATWTQINGTLSNPTTAVGGSSDCSDVNVGNQQAWYNQAIAVDPSDSGHVIVGGMLCGLRTLNGLSSSPTWENISHWLPSGGGGSTSAGTLPYVHADWHAATVLRTSSGYIVFAGSDGGLFSSTNVFDSTVTPPNVVWSGDNKGLVTHLFYSVASGDPANGNAYVAFGGLQDNGTRFRNTSTSNSTVFDQVIGGDGFGTAAATDTSGTTVYWASVEYAHERCVPSSSNNSCDKGGAWSQVDPSLSRRCSYSGYSDAQPFNVRYAYARGSSAANTFITATDLTVYRSIGTSNWTTLSPCQSGFIREVAASDTIDGLYGIALSGGRFSVTTAAGCGSTSGTCTWTISTGALGSDVNGDGTISNSEKMAYTSSIAFPPTTPSGKTAGDVYLAASSAPVMYDGSTLVPDSVGHLFVTYDRGVTFTPFHGNGTGADLPNVGINVVRYDPADTTNNTIYVGTQLGIYRSTDGGNTWARYGVGFPMASATSLFIAKNGSLLRASTYGRGLWEIYPSATSEKGVNGNGDWDRNLQLDGFDLGELSSRLGTTPATTSQPYYDWNVDLTGSVNAVDESDLTAFLTNFGNHP